MVTRTVFILSLLAVGARTRHLQRRADGTGLRRIRAKGGDPAPSPDGRQVAFAWTPDGANQELFVMRRDGTGVRQITATNGIMESGPDWQRGG